MPDGLSVTPVIAGSAAHRKAESACCAAKLNPGPEPDTFLCRECGEPTDLVLGEAREFDFSSERTASHG